MQEFTNLGEVLPLWSSIPFLLMLLSIALFPLILPKFWLHNYQKISIILALTLAIPFVVIYKGEGLHEILHVVIADYLPFIILLWALYTVSGGVLLKGILRGTPVVNTIILIIGTLLASWMGTTGAAMLLIRPLIKANDYRKKKAHIFIFFIFLVANMGGCLTPLGDPPLFMGFLHGVSFFWTMSLLPELLVGSTILISIFFILDSYYYKKEKIKITNEKEKRILLKLKGTHNFIFLVAIIISVLLSGIIDLGKINTFGVHRPVMDWVRDILLILIGILSLRTTSKKIYRRNSFTWAPIIEVAYLFIGIFVTMVPCLLILKAGDKGALASLIKVIKEPYHYFWITGSLSSFLDNTPTYLTFFSYALGNLYHGIPEAQSVPLLMTENSIYLKAISSGAVFFGAMTYIGNAPNFMVRSIAEEHGVNMPGFLAYIVKYSLIFLIPTFIIITFIFY